MFRRKTAEKLGRVARQVIPPLRQPPQPIPPTPIRTCKTPAGGIAARNTTTNAMSSASCDLYIINADDELEDSTEDLTVWNPFRSAIAASMFIQVGHYNGRWMVISEEC